MARRKIFYKPCENCGNNYWQICRRMEKGVGKKTLFCNVCYMEVPVEEFKNTSHEGPDEERIHSIGRNGIRSVSAGGYYWSEWMAGMKGTRVYLRRNPGAEDFRLVEVFDAKKGHCLGNARMAESIAVPVTTDIEKEQLKKFIKKNHEERIRIRLRA